MAEDRKTVQKQEATRKEGVERTRDRRTYMPGTNISEGENDYILTAAMPGAGPDTVDINFEDGELTITARVEESPLEKHELAAREYEVGDYQRTFRFPEDVDADRIEAAMSNGILKLTLPKTEKAKPKKITVKAG